MSSVQAVLWDMDGVLLDSERLCQQAFIEVVDGLELAADPAELYLETIGLNYKGILDWYESIVGGREQAEYLCKSVSERYIQIAQTDLVLKPGVEAALMAVKQSGLPQMVVTSTRSDIAHEKLSRMNIRQYFTDVLGGDQVSHGKPNPEPYLNACAQLKLSPNNALVIEDSANGVRSGLAAGAMVVHVPDLINTDPSWVNEIYKAMATLEDFPSWFAAQQAGDWV